MRWIKHWIFIMMLTSLTITAWGNCGGCCKRDANGNCHACSCLKTKPMDSSKVQDILKNINQLHEKERGLIPFTRSDIQAVFIKVCGSTETGAELMKEFDQSANEYNFIKIKEGYKFKGSHSELVNLLSQANARCDFNRS